MLQHIQQQANELESKGRELHSKGHELELSKADRAQGPRHTVARHEAGEDHIRARAPESSGGSAPRARRCQSISVRFQDTLLEDEADLEAQLAALPKTLAAPKAAPRRPRHQALPDPPAARRAPSRARGHRLRGSGALGPLRGGRCIEPMIGWLHAATALASSFVSPSASGITAPGCFR